METNDMQHELFTEAMSAFMTYDYDKCIGFLTQIISRDENHVLALTTRGAAHFKQGRLEAALSDLNRAIAVDGTNARAHHIYGLVLEKRGDDEKALRAFTRALELDPGYGAAYYSRASQHSKMGDADAAVSDTRAFTQLTHQHVEEFSNENNIIQTRHLQFEETVLETELDR